MEVVKVIWDFFQSEILGMKWLNRLMGYGLEALGIDVESRIGGSFVAACMIGIIVVGYCFNAIEYLLVL